MSEAVRRVFVEKKSGFDVEARAMLADLRQNLSLDALTGVRIINRYDVSGISDEEYAKARNLIFSEPPVDNCFDEHIEIDDRARVFAIEYLPGQYDQRADSAEECISILTQKKRPIVKSAKIIVLSGDISDTDFKRVKGYIINPVESREASLEKPENLEMDITMPGDVAVMEGFISLDNNSLEKLVNEMGFAMDTDDLQFCRDYFKNEEKRNPTVTELRMIDTYWSDHCRHTTFGTKIENVKIPDGKYSEPLKQAYEDYIKVKDEIYPGGRDTTLMDIALMAMKKLRRDGVLTRLDESEEINACSINAVVDVDGHDEQWLVMFKNETHNHPTEIEPFGGAATCLGGAIRDPLSGRSYVYQAMRITGAGDPRRTMEQTLDGKLMQRKIVRTAASGYSSYGNQIGLATGQVAEIYHEGYVAKHMELGAVIAAAPKENVIRKIPVPGDVVILLGGKTGRDGCGGATGSSKAHTAQSLETCGAEVQKGNPPVERKIQRLFRRGEVTRLIKRCNDFGAGGVSVAIGELADGLDIDLDKVPKKYEGLDGTELAISESQERMAVVVDKDDAQKFIDYAKSENLDAVITAVVTDKNRLTMKWRGKVICDISRDFLNTNGAAKTTDVEVILPDENKNPFKTEAASDLEVKWLKTLSSLNVCSQKGLAEMFDSTIGAGSVLMPFGGKHCLSPAIGMVAKIPVMQKTTDTATVMTYGYDPYLSSWSPFYGSLYAVIESVSKAVAIGARYDDIYLTLQEYFERLGDNPTRWGKPFSALLGAFTAQQKLKLAAIGGKDSMSGSFVDLDVPPTLVSFAVNTLKASKTVSSEFKKAGSTVVIVKVDRDENLMPDFERLCKNYSAIHRLIQDGIVLSSNVVCSGGLCEAISKMCFGNMLGFDFDKNITPEDVFAKEFGAIVLEITDISKLDGLDYEVVGITTNKSEINVCAGKISLYKAVSAWTETLEKVYPTKAEGAGVCETYSFERKNIIVSSEKFARPRVFIPVFPGTNCEYDSARAFEAAGAQADVLPFINLTPADTTETLEEMAKRINNSQIVMLPGGFSGGDEPDGSGKYIATAFRNPKVSEAVNNLLAKRDGLMLGICNGFQALIKLGLVTHGFIVDLQEDSPTLTYNNIGRHVSAVVTTRIASNSSPWLYGTKVGDLHSIAVSHGEGRFYCDEKWLKKLVENGQIATQYVDLNGKASGEIPYNPNGSVAAIEGITSPDGRVFGKMGHSERFGENICINIDGQKDQKLFESGVKYFK